MQIVTSKRLPELQRSRKNTKEYKNAWSNTGTFGHSIHSLILLSRFFVKLA